MAYEVIFFCKTRSATATAFACEVHAAISQRWESAVFGPEHTSASIVSRDVWSAGTDAPILLECQLGGEDLETNLRHVSTEPGGKALSGANALIRTILSGADADWPLFEVIWQVAKDQFSGIPYDEMDGFEASLH